MHLGLSSEETNIEAFFKYAHSVLGLWNLIDTYYDVTLRNI